MRRIGGAFLIAGFVAVGTGLAVAQDASGSSSSLGGGDGECKMSFRDALRMRESSGNYGIKNRFGYLGAYQFGPKALQDLGYLDNNGRWTGKDGIRTEADFLNSPEVQEKAQTEWERLLDARTAGLAGFIGQDAPGCPGVKITQEGIRGMAHLIGPRGAGEYLRSGGVCGTAGTAGLKYRTLDGNGVCGGSYLCKFSGCADIKKDMSKNTCDVTMPMIKGINCANYPTELRSFCEQTKPYLMTRAECDAAESFAKRAPKGPNKEACENLTFGPGTGSWSFVLACSYASEAPADHDGKPNPTATWNDPECISKLKGMGVEFREMGHYSTGRLQGQECVVNNPVQYAGGAIPFGQVLTMSCDAALAMEQFGQQLKALGVTGYYGIASTYSPCRPKRDKRGNLPGTISGHSLGTAVDIAGLKVGGRKVSMDAMLKPMTPDGMIAVQAKNIACSVFNVVLTPAYEQYKGVFGHFHLEVTGGKQNSCK